MSEHEPKHTWVEVQEELARLRAELAALSPPPKQKPTLEQLKAKLAEMEAGIESDE